MKCPNCRNEISNNSLRCPYCNYLIADSRATGNYTTPVYSTNDGVDPRYGAQQNMYNTRNDSKAYPPAYNEYYQDGYCHYCYGQKQKNTESGDWDSVLLAMGVLNIGLQIILLVLMVVILFQL